MDRNVEKSKIFCNVISFSGSSIQLLMCWSAVHRRRKPPTA